MAALIDHAPVLRGPVPGNLGDTYLGVTTLPALPPSDQTFILHALDGSLGDPAVVDVYRRFIAATPYPMLRAEARRYAAGWLGDEGGGS